MKVSFFSQKSYIIIKSGCFLTILFFCIHSRAQVFAEKKYPKNYFSWPVQAPVGIVANFGELRPNHYHMGLDCRTEKKQNLPVLAAANGYIAKVKIEPYGFGRAIYINHPNGLTTLYAHLNNFYPELEKYVTRQQYKLQSWRVFIDIPADLFPVTQKQFIAYSGNTGGSQGPHVHFEIRETKTDKVLNPLLFGFPIPDKVAPSLLRLALYDRQKSTFEQTPQLYALKKTGQFYTISPSVITVNTNTISFAVTAVDKNSTSPNPNGIFEATLFDNENPILGFQLDNISYDETRFLNAHIDFRLKAGGGPYVEHLSQLPGYTNGIYKEFAGNGVIDLTDDTTLHQIKIEVKDAAGNISIIKFAIKNSFITKKNLPAISKKNDQRLFLPGFVNVYESNSLRVYLPETSLYDSLRFFYAENNVNTPFPVYQLHYGNIPVHRYFPVSIKCNTENPEKIVMHRFWNGKHDYSATINEKGWYKASFREFGNFQLMEDNTPPAITPVGFKNGMNCSKLSAIKFVIRDNTEEITKFTALLDGEWLRFSNDKGKTFVYIFDEHCPPGDHELIISAEDQVGNKTEKTYHFKR